MPMLPLNTLQGQVAIVTGGGTGLGRAMALEFSRFGARLVLASRNLEHLEPTAAEICKEGGEAISVVADIRDPAQVDRMIQTTKERFGGVDILVNNAAGTFICKAEDLSPNGWRTVVDIVLNGSFYCSRAAARAKMLAQIPTGRMVRPEEIAQGAAYLVSPYADYINGENLTMAGGGWLGKGFLAYQ